MQIKEKQKIFDIQGQIEEYQVIVKKLNKNLNFLLMKDNWDTIFTINCDLISNLDTKGQKLLFKKVVMSYENGFLAGANFVKYEQTKNFIGNN
mgnify:CR=1 FL=1